MTAIRQHMKANSLMASHAGPFMAARILLLLLLVFAPLAGWAQSADPNPDPDQNRTPSSSEHVEESEEAYRRRMELEEANDQADIIIDRSSGPLKAPEGMEALPYESRKHLRDELRNVIMEQGEWQPEDVQANYPYVPSEAAQKDPELRKQEQEAWGELITEYHEREAAALAGGGRAGQPGSGQGPGQNSGQAGSGSQSSGSQGSASQGSGPPPGSQPSSSAAGAGVSQSALEFLKGQQANSGSGSGNPGQPGNPGQQGDPNQPESDGQPAAAEATASASTADTSGTEEQEATGESGLKQIAQSEQGQEEKNKAEDRPQEQAQNAKEAMEQKKKESSTESPPPPPGSLAIGELVALNEGVELSEDQEEAADASQEASESSSSESSESQSGDQPPPPPGTIAIPELENLQGLDEDEEGA